MCLPVTRALRSDVLYELGSQAARPYAQLSFPALVEALRQGMLLLVDWRLVNITLYLSGQRLSLSQSPLKQ